LSAGRRLLSGHYLTGHRGLVGNRLLGGGRSGRPGYSAPSSAQQPTA